MHRFLAITLPHWSITARARLHSGPVLVVVRCKGAKAVHAASASARADGVERGMPLAQARALLRSVPLELDHDPAADRRALHALSRWCLRISPRVFPRIDPSNLGEPAVILVDLTGMERVHRGEDRLVPRLRAHMDRLRVECTLWTACTQAAACAAGWAAAPGVDGIIKQGEERWRTHACPVRALQIPPETVAMLDEVHVRTAEDLRGIQRSQIAARFGSLVLDRLDAIEGRVMEPFHAMPIIPDVQATVRFDGPCPQLEALCQAVQSCIEQVGAQLRARGRGARAFVLRVSCSDLPTHAWTVRCTQPVDGWPAVRPLVVPTLHDLPLGHGVELVQVLARSLRRMPGAQGALHSAGAPAPYGALWVDGIRERLGHDAVHVLRTHATRLHTWHGSTQPVDPELPKVPVEGQAPTIACSSMVSQPSCAWPQPERIAVARAANSSGASSSATSSSAAASSAAASSAPWPTPPERFVWRGHAWCVRTAQGPQRLAGAWWHAHDPGERDYWRVQVLDGTDACAWLALARHPDGSWWVHGAWT